MKQILKTLVGSKAHGLDNPNSDTDMRGVFLVPTSDILSLGYKEKSTSWVEGQGEDATSYELHHFLNLACHSNPSILEVLVSPVIEATHEGEALRELFPYIWNSADVFNAFSGYSHNQRKKFLEDKNSRPWKFACAQCRVLLLGIELLKTGSMTVDVQKQEVTLAHAGVNLGNYAGTLRGYLLAIKAGECVTKGEVIDWAEHLQRELAAAYSNNPNKQTDYARVNAFLLKTRKENW
jgi:hypothetical protein